MTEKSALRSVQLVPIQRDFFLNITTKVVKHVNTFLKTTSKVVKHVDTSFKTTTKVANQGGEHVDAPFKTTTKVALKQRW